MTPEFLPDWCFPGEVSLSKTKTSFPRLWSFNAADKPTMPAPITACVYTFFIGGGAGSRTPVLPSYLTASPSASDKIRSG